MIDHLLAYGVIALDATGLLLEVASEHAKRAADGLHGVVEARARRCDGLAVSA